MNNVIFLSPFNVMLATKGHCPILFIGHCSQHSQKRPFGLLFWLTYRVFKFSLGSLRRHICLDLGFGGDFGRHLHRM